MNWIKNLFIPAGRFRIPRVLRNLPDCEIRLLRDTDFAACEAIYRLNEAAHFPAGYFERFSDWLRNHRALIIVAESNSEIRGFGGMAVSGQDSQCVAGLGFGMVHPAYHRQGFGTVLLLSRLAVLWSPSGRSLVLLNTTGGSETFYCRFGFKFASSSNEANDFIAQHYFVTFLNDDAKRCLRALRHIRYAPQIAEVAIPPLTPLRDLPEIAATIG